MGPFAHSAAALAVLVGAPLGAVGCALQPSWRVGLRERLGASPQAAPGTLWIHAASVGETRAAATLLRGLAARRVPVLLTHTSAGGRNLADAALSSAVRSFAPLEHPWCVAAALGRVKPVAIALVESEIWPVGIAVATDRAIPVGIVSARISDRSFARYRRAGRLIAPTFARLAAVGARSEVDAERFAELGTPEQRIEVSGDLKLDAPGTAPVLAADVRVLLGDGPCWVAGSTHADEERAVARAQQRLRKAGLGVKLVLAPRKPERAAEVEALLADEGLRTRRRSCIGDAPLEADEVLLVDGVGELRSFYERADLAFVGGTLAPVGAHNLLEPVQLGTAVLYGPELDKVRASVELLESCDAGACVRDAEQLGSRVEGWLADRGALRERGRRGRAELERHRGSADRTLALLERWAGVPPIAATPASD